MRKLALTFIGAAIALGVAAPAADAAAAKPKTTWNLDKYTPKAVKASGGWTYNKKTKWLVVNGKIKDTTPIDPGPVWVQVRVGSPKAKVAARSKLAYGKWAPVNVPVKVAKSSTKVYIQKCARVMLDSKPWTKTVCSPATVRLK